MSDTQKNQILNCLLTGARITAKDAQILFGCYRLASRMNEIKQMGYDLRKEMIRVPCRDGKHTRVAQYWIEPEKKPEPPANFIEGFQFPLHI